MRLPYSAALASIVPGVLVAADPILYVVDCVQNGQQPRSYLSYFSNNNAYGQTKPDSTVVTYPYNGLAKYSGDYAIAGLGSISLNIDKDYADTYSRTGGFLLNDNHRRWRCYSDDGRVLYADRSFATPESPFAQCVTRHYCSEAKAGGKFKVRLDYAVVCEGGETASCGAIHPSVSLEFILWDSDKTTTLCYSILDGLEEDSHFDENKTYEACGMTVTIRDVRLGFFGAGAAWDVAVTAEAGNGETVRYSEDNVSGSYSTTLVVDHNKFDLIKEW
jgi:hypothetical protein